jgi:aldehyde:ferredoxin oxidoreductase
MTEKRGGFAGTILYVDLTKGEVSQKPLDFALAEKFIGGLGLCLKLAYDIIRPGTPALSPDNPVVLGTGPLVGTNLPSSSRVFAVTKLPTSNTIGWCGAGGVNFGYLFKNTGYDNVIIEGKADHPVYLKIINDQVEICDAADLWGKDVEETYRILRQSFNIPVGIAAIGQAGENLVPFSMAFIDRIATLGRGGFGAVMGAKNLKAIVVHGDQGIRVADRKRYKTLSKAFLQRIREWRYLKEWQDLGLIKSFPLVPVETYKKIKKRRIACVSCPIGCKDVVQIQDGEFKGLVAGSSSAANFFYPMVYGFKDYRKAIKCIATLDRYGLDLFEFFGIMTFAKILCDNGIIPKSQIDCKIVVDSLESMETWAKKISLREGLGDILADGFNRILEEFGEKSKAYAPSLVKGMHPYAGPGSALPWDLFGTMELGQLMDPRGPHVGSGGSPTYFARRPLEGFPRHLERMGVPPEAIERILPGIDDPQQEEDLKIGSLLKYSHAWFTTLGSLGVCARGQINRFYNASLCAELYETVTGIKTSLEDLRQRVERVWTLYKMANLREGVDRKAEDPPDQWIGKSGFKNYVDERPLTLEDIEGMVEDYYAEWGWDRKTGVPTADVLEKLGLADS